MSHTEHYLSDKVKRWRRLQERRKKIEHIRRLQDYKERISELKRVREGGPGSGFFGHSGRPGQVGGSSSDGGDASPREPGEKETGFRGEIIGKGEYSGKTTASIHQDAEGKWTPERRVLHQKILSTVFGKATPVDNPTIIFTGGGTASGKSYLQREIIKGEIPENSVHLDPDEIKKLLPEFSEMKAGGDKNASPFVHDESAYLTKIAIETIGNGKYNALVDTTGNGSLDELTAEIKALRAGGGRVVAHYVTLDVETALKAAIERAERKGGRNEGRYVSESNIRFIHKAVSQILPKAIEKGLFDEVTVWDMRGKKATKIASAKGNKLTIHKEDWWKEFLAKGE